MSDFQPGGGGQEPTWSGQPPPAYPSPGRYPDPGPYAGPPPHPGAPYVGGQYPGQYPGAGPSGPRASFGSRLGAWIIDGVILFVISLVLDLLLRNAGSLLSVLIDAGYIVYFFGSPRGQSPGYMATGIRVISMDGTGAIGYGRAFLRWLVSIPSAWVIFLGYFWMLWDREKQTWFDKASNSVVVPVSAYPLN
ncbi:MAG: RDD family protein [Acidimicrobiales bacterium]